MPKSAAPVYRTANWPEYNAALKRRRSLEIWFDPERHWLSKPCGRPSRPMRFLDSAIELCLTLKTLFNLPLRQVTGLASSLIKMAGEGEWKTRKHGASYRRQWRKMHLGIDSEALRVTKRLGRAIWKKWSGDHRRSLIETEMRCFKLLGQRVVARTFDRQIAELKVCAAILNRFSEIRHR